MTTRIYREDNLIPRRTNLAPNPRPAGDASGWNSDPIGGLTLVTDDDGLDSLELVAPDGSSVIYADPGNTVEDFKPALGEYIAIGVEVRALAADTAADFTLRLNGYGGTTVEQQGAPSRPISTTGYTRVTATAVVTAYAPAGWARTFLWQAAPDAGSGFRFRRAVVAIASSESAALDAVATYFDGDTVDPTGEYRYQWAGTPSASTSVELGPGYTVEPTLVIDYADDRPTGVTAHDTILGGPPVIARIPSRRAQRGTYAFFCETEDRALNVADICDGRANVAIVSDDVPGAPLTFCPTESVRVAWNAPYNSWTTSVPYVKVSQ